MRACYPIMDPLVKETAKEFTQDVIFGIMFAMVAFLSCWRMVIYFDPFGGGKVITTFYGLLFGAAILRSIWFLIPKVFLGKKTILYLIEVRN